MAQEQNISTQLDNLLVTRNFAPEMLDRQGKPSESEDAKTFTFDYVSGSGKNYGTMVVILDSENDMKVFYGDNLGRAMEGDDKDEFFDFQQHLSKFARMHRWTYTAKDLNQLKHTMQGLAAIQEGLFEGYYGTRKISYAGEPTEARLMIKHNRTLGEADARFRYVESLFIETADSQRFKLAFKNLAGGRAMLEHVRQGGNPYDVRGVHIAEMVMEIATLSRFNRASARRMLEGTTKELVTEAQTYYKSLRENMKRMASPRGYNAYFETWHPATIDEQQDLVEDIKTLFIEQTLDTRIEAALPLLARIQQQGNAMKEAQIFENWINNLSEGTWALPETPEQLNRLKELMATELIVGPDATNATEQLYDLIGDDILFDRLSDLAERDPRANAFDDTEVMDRLEALGIQMSEPSVPGNPAEPATAPAAPVAEDSVLDRARQSVQSQGFSDSPEERNADRLERKRRHYAALDRISNIGGLGSEEEAKHQAQQRMARDAYDTQRRKDDDEDTRKTFDMFRDRLNRMQYKNQRDVDPEQLAKISAIKYDPIREGAAPGVDAKGRTQSQWIQMVKAKFPDGKMIQAKMPDGPVQVTLPDGRKLGWKKVEQAVAQPVPATEGAMPASVIRIKEKIRLMSDAEKKEYFQGKSKEQLQKMARSHGYGENSNVYAKYATEDMAEDDLPEQAVAESAELNTMLKYAGVPVAESRILDEAGETLDHILNRFKHEVAQFEQGADLDDNLYDALYDYYSDAGEIPYGIAKARTGDPYEWITDRLDKELGTGNHAMRDLPEADPISTFEVMSGFAAPVANEEIDPMDSEKTEKFLNKVAGAGTLGVGFGILEGSCNMTMEGEYCPEHGLMECGMGEMTVAGSMAPVMGEAGQDPMHHRGAVIDSFYESTLARIKSLALIK